MQNNKSPGSDGLTTEFYRAFWDIISTYVVNSFNYASKCWKSIYFSTTRDYNFDSKEKKGYPVF